MKRLYLLFLIAFTSFGVHAQLDRSAAAKIISQGYPIPIEKKIELVQLALLGSPILGPGGTFQPWQQSKIDEMRNNLNRLSAAGFIKFTESKIERRVFKHMEGNVQFNLEPQAAMKALIVNATDKVATVRVGQIEFGKISGMRDIESGAKIVEFDTVVKLNPLAEHTNVSDHERKGQSMSVRLAKYDDGWRVLESR